MSTPDTDASLVSRDESVCGDIQKSTFARGAVSGLWPRTPGSPDAEAPKEAELPPSVSGRESTTVCVGERECSESITEGYTICRF